MPSILLVDPNPSTRDCTCRTLSAEGWAVRCHGSGRQAYEEIMAAPPDLVVQEISLPDLDGLELLARVAGRHPSVPVIIYTGNQSQKDNFLTWMAEAYVVRRPDAGPLLRAVRRVLRCRQNSNLPVRAPMTLPSAS